MTFYGQLNIDKIINDRYFRNKKQGFFIECGAYDGVIDSNTLYFYKNKDWRGINIEALPNLFTELEKNRPEDLNLNLALSDKDGKSIFTQAVDSRYQLYGGHFGNGSLNHTKEHMQELKNRNCSFVEYDVITESLPTLFKKYVTKKPDLFILDVEGHEKTVISKLSEIDTSLHPDVWCIEYGYAGYDGIVSIMKENDYILDYKDRINLVFSKGQSND
jgi:FkbM family methyltransferase